MRKLFPGLALLILFTLGCQRSEKVEEAKKAEPVSDKKIAARINGRPIYEEDLR